VKKNATDFTDIVGMMMDKVVGIHETIVDRNSKT